MIEIKNLVKQFQNETEIEYRDITFETGKSYMLLGASGCGKSTLLNMIAGVLSPTRGDILIDGVNMSAASQKLKDRFRIEKIGYIFQDFKLISDMTVADNIGILRLEGVDISRMDNMLQALDIQDKKNARIKHLSGGQKQRVAIARAILRRSPIIILDEATASVDVETERQIQQAIQNMAGQRPIVAIAHRLSTIRHADQILVIDEGKVAECGTHDELVAKDGIYARMHRIQSAARENL